MSILASTSRRLRTSVASSIRSYSVSVSHGPGQLEGLRCLITGASQGIGRAIAQRFASEGASCIAVGRNEHTLRSVTEDLAAVYPTTGVDHSFRVGDVTDRGFWDGVRNDVNPLDILVNAAGTTHSSLLMSTSPGQIEQIIQTNLMGTVWACKALSKTFIRQKKGCIINVSSLLGVKGGKGSSVYAASKAGIIGLTRALASEIGPSGVRVNAILPGYIDTEMTQKMSKDALTEALNSIPLKRLGDVYEVADAALFLARNTYVNNCMLNIDGGISAV